MPEVLELALLLHVFRLYHIQIRESQEKSSRPLAKMLGKAYRESIGARDRDVLLSAV